MHGQTINGYTLKHRLGEGGMAEVWYAENEIGKPAAVKILNENLSRKTQIVERFHNEALVMVKLNHPNIRQVYGYGYLGDRHCIIMEYLDGDDLEAMLKAGRRFTDEEVCRWWNQTVDALNYTHAMGIVHRDIKPSNIFLDNMGNIKLLDFGIAKVKESMSMTRTGMMMGTLMYMSPEQVKDPKRVDAKSDIYSLAVTFVHLLSGKPVYDSETSSEFDIQLSIVSQPVDLSCVPSAWQGFLAPYLEKDPEKRPALRHFDAVQPVQEPTRNVEEDETLVVNQVKQPVVPDTDKEVILEAPKQAKPVSEPHTQAIEDKIQPAQSSKKSSKKTILIICAVFLLICLCSLAVFYFNRGSNFASGRVYVVQFDDPSIKVEDVRVALSNAIIDKAGIRNALEMSDNAVVGDWPMPEVKNSGANGQMKITTNFLIDNDNPLVDGVIESILYDNLEGLYAHELTFEEFSSTDKTKGIISVQKFGMPKGLNDNERVDKKGIVAETQEKDIIIKLSNNSQDPIFLKAIETATEWQKYNNCDFVTLFGVAFEEQDPNARLSGIFINELHEKGITINSTNNEVLEVLKKECNVSKENDFSNIIHPVQWIFVIKDRNESEFDLIATAIIDPDYHIPSTTMPDLGPLQTEFDIKTSEFFEAVGEARDLTDVPMYYDDLLEVEYKQFSGTASFAQTFHKLKKGSFPITGEISYQAYKDGQCVALYEEDVDLMYKN